MKDFLTAVNERFLVGDGSMGILLFTRLGSKYRTTEEFNLYQPEDVLQLHREYLDAEAEVLTTNTFTANRAKLAQSGLTDKLAELNRTGISLAREAAGDRAWVAGSMGPTGKLLEPLGDLSTDEARETFAEQASLLAEGGADLIAIETMSALEEAQAAYDAVRSVTKLPVAVSFTFDANIRTMMGVTPEQAVQAALEWGADLVGTNCGVGPDEVEQVIERMAKTSPDALLWSEPNAGLPRLEGDRAVYDLSPERFADYAQKVARLGARVVGSCCGSTPDHIRAMAQRLAQVS
jgi:5-methyltetrahydrofolate--homocysteine methyltransferase